MNRTDTKTLLVGIYQTALAAVAPGPVLARALQAAPPAQPADVGVWVVALGKAAHPMAEAAVQVLAHQGRPPAGGLVVPAVDGPSPHRSIAVAVGDHPEPGQGSLAAAEALDRLVKTIPAGDTVWVLLSGGTTSLIGAPQPGIAPHELKALYAQLLRSGLDIKEMNRVRKRFTRWSAGRLAQSLAHAGLVRCYIVSDVIGDDLAAIGSGPCVPDPSTAREVRGALVRAGLFDGLAPSLRQHLDEVEHGGIPETPKAGDRAVDRVESTIIASNHLALEAAAERARELGFAPEIVGMPLSGEAAIAGAEIAGQLIAGDAVRNVTRPLRCLILGGETTVTFGDQAGGIGGRCQELALAAARVLHGIQPPVALLAGGTDGRDGPTDAAGAVVDGATWQAMIAAGRDPARDLEQHDSHPALESAGALIRTGSTGTNVMDLVIGVS